LDQRRRRRHLDALTVQHGTVTTHDRAPFDLGSCMPACMLQHETGDDDHGSSKKQVVRSGDACVLANAYVSVFIYPQHINICVVA